MWKGIISTYTAASIERNLKSMALWFRSGTTCIPNGARADARFAKDIDDHLKRKAQKYYEEHIGTRDDFIREFGKSYL